MSGDTPQHTPSFYWLNTQECRFLTDGRKKYYYKRKMKIFLDLIKWLSRLIYPPRCIFCGLLLETDTAVEICSGCHDRMPFLEKKVFSLDNGSNTSGCDGVICICKYSGIVKESLIRFKFYDRPGYFRTFAGLLSERINELLGARGFDMLISVPLHKNKELSRGYNQAYLISRSMGRELGIPDRSGLLERIRCTDAQSLLRKGERQQNVTGAFRVTDPEKVRDKSILLIDDIITTGYTINECSRVLKESGALSVTAAVVASGRKF